MSLLFHQTLIEVAGWCASGRGSEMLHSCVRRLRRNVWKAGPNALTCDLGLECSHMASLAWWPELSFLITQGSKSKNSRGEGGRPKAFYDSDVSVTSIITCG